jgi:PAS domain S-box-containing protein
MDEDGNGYDPKRLLRRRAEDRLRADAAKPGGAGSAGGAADADPERLIHELTVHQLELEMQNDELRRTYRELEISRARYQDLYDFAPVAYFTIDDEGTVQQANLTAAILLGIGRADLLRRPFTDFVLPEDQDVYYRHRRALLESGSSQSDELRMVRRDAGPFWVHLKSAVSKAEDGSTACRVIVSDVDDRRKAGQERELLIAELQEALEKVKLLSGLLPICAWCKKVRDDQGYWNAIENYVSRHSEAEFTHGICPECRSRYYGEVDPGEE